MRYTNIEGHRGSWFVDVTWEGGNVERMPCVHQYYWTQCNQYHDPVNYELGGKNAFDHSQFKEWLEAIRELGVVVLAKDKINDDREEGTGFFTRNGYVGVYDVANVETGDNEFVKFNFINRHIAV